MKTDIEIAQEVKLEPIAEVAQKTLGIEGDDLELYGKYKAKLSDTLEKRLKKKKNGKIGRAHV